MNNLFVITMDTEDYIAYERDNHSELSLNLYFFSEEDAIRYLLDIEGVRFNVDEGIFERVEDNYRLVYNVVELEPSLETN